MAEILIKRVYDSPASGDGFRVLVDRLWPRGMTKEKVDAVLWLKEVAPSNELRHWFNHDPAKWEEFKSRYIAELAGEQESVKKILDLAARGTVTLLYGSREEKMNQAVVLREYLMMKMGMV